MIEVIKPGLLTTIQDGGRWGYQAYGVPVSGAMDLFAYKVANMLVGNHISEAVLEMTIQGGQYRFHQENYIALCGADMKAKLNKLPCANWSCIKVNPGDELKLGYAAQGSRGYLAVRGGINEPLVLGSRSTYLRSRLGGKEGRVLKAGDRLFAGHSTVQEVNELKLPDEVVPVYAREYKVSFIPGPQDDYFTLEGVKTLTSGEYKISANSDRMGYRLEGPHIEHRQKADIISDALCFGSIQVPADGQPIIMMADHQTTGGYAKIGTVIQADLMKIAQCKPGDVLTFEEVSETEAVARLKEQGEIYQKIKNILNN